VSVIKGLLENLNQASEKNKLIGKFSPVFEAMDGFFYGTDKVTTIPHVLDHIDVKRYMSFVIFGLLPATVAAIYFWGLRILLVIAVSYIFGGMVEVAFAITRKKGIHEGFLVTGLIFPLTLPSAVPLWVVAVGVMFGVFFGKEVFGGTGKNTFNPALIGRIFLSVAFPSMMSVGWQKPFTSGLGGFVHYQNSLDALATATPLSLFRGQGTIASYLDLLFGYNSGCIGETFRIGLIVGGLFLILTRIVNWRLPLSALLSVIIFSFLGNHFAPEKFAPPMFQFLSGGLLLGAFFMVTDPVTCPVTKVGKWIGGILFGFLVVLIRSLSGYVEGVMFSIVLLNVFSPFIDHVVLDIKYPKVVK
jgi:Na+-transporting NADH:ubiquinone oxidoreductase subunit B